MKITMSVNRAVNEALKEKLTFKFYQAPMNIIGSCKFT